MREMKDSGVRWIGSIPAEWTITQVRRQYNSVKRIVGEDADKYERLALTLKGVIKRSKEDNEGLQPEQFEGYQILKENELVFKMIDLENVNTSRVGLSPYTGLVSPAYIILSNNATDNRYAYYWFMSMYYQEIFNKLGGAGVRSALNAKDMLSLPIPDLSSCQQKTIADYLDRKCSAIDTIIAKQEQIIERLKAYKLALITEAVTKGLDPNVEMKDSGLDWAGKIPKQWAVTKNTNVSKTSSGATPDRSKFEEFYQNGTIKWIRTLDLNDWFVNDSSEYITELGLACSSCSIMPKGTICVAMYGGAGTIGKCGLLTEDAATNQAVCSIVPGDGLLSEYILFQLIAMKKYWMKYAAGTRKDPNISQEIVGSMKIIIPSKADQIQIVEWLTHKTNQIDNAIAIREALLCKIQQYRKSLIYEVVTGKKEV